MAARIMRVLPLAVLAAALLVAAAPAGAATRIGASTAADQGCGSDVTVVQDISSADAPTYTVPQGGGIITSWGFNARANPGVRKLKIMRPTGTSGAYFVGAESAAQTGMPNQRNDFKTRIRVNGGELLAFYTSTGDGCRGAGPSGNLVRAGEGDPAVGSFFQATSLFLNPSLLDVTADIEADADRDGYGDETQDLCPSDGAVFATSCDADLRVALTAEPSRVRLGQRITYTMRAANDGPLLARNVVLRQQLPAGAALVSTTKGCKGFATIRCDVGNLGVGATTREYTVVVRAPDVGDLTSTLTATSATADSATANNSAAATVSVLPPRFGGARVSPRDVSVVRRALPVVVSCPISARSCKGTVALTTASAVRVRRGAKAERLVLGDRTFRVTGGKRRTIRVPLARATRSWLSSRRRVRIVAAAQSNDAFGQSATRTTKLAVVRGARR